VAGHQNLVVLDANMKGAVPVTALNSRDVTSARRLNSKRLLVTTGTIGTKDFDAKGGGLFAIDRDGTNARQVGESGDEQMGGGNQFVVRPLAPARATISSARSRSRTTNACGRAISCASTRAPAGALRCPPASPRPPRARRGWWIATGCRASSWRPRRTRRRIYYRAGADSPWRKLDEFSTLAGGAWTPLEIAEDNKTLYVASWKANDKAQIVRYDPETRAFGEIIAQHPQVDLTRMKSALERAGQKPIWIVADGEGHGFRDMKNQVMFYGAMEKFLDENIGK